MAIRIAKQFLDEVGGVPVERITNVKRSNERLPLGQEPNGVLHTTEGHFSGSLDRFRRETGTPTFMIGYETLKIVTGPDGKKRVCNEPRASNTRLRVAQFMPIGEMALTLKNPRGGTETNREAVVQVELIGTSVNGPDGFGPWTPPEPVLAVLADLFRQCFDACGIPLQRGGNGSRDVALWDGKAGWFGHGEVPENDHTDPRGIDWHAIFDRAAPKRKEVWQVRSGGQTLRQEQVVEGPPSGYEKLLAWMQGKGQNAVRKAEQANGQVTIRKVEIPR